MHMVPSILFTHFCVEMISEVYHMSSKVQLGCQTTPPNEWLLMNDLYCTFLVSCSKREFYLAEFRIANLICFSVLINALISCQHTRTHAHTRTYPHTQQTNFLPECLGTRIWWKILFWAGACQGKFHPAWQFTLLFLFSEILCHLWLQWTAYISCRCVCMCVCHKLKTRNKSLQPSGWGAISSV